MRPWHYARIRFTPVEPRQAPDESWIFFFIEVRNSDRKSPFRETHYAMHTLGM